MRESVKGEEGSYIGEWRIPVEIDLVKDKSLSHGALRLYLILLGYARAKNTAFPSEKTLAKDLGCSERYVGELKKELKEKNLIEWEKREGKTNLYTLLQYRPIVRGTIVHPTERTAVPYPQGTAVPSKNTKPKNIKNIMGHAHNKPPNHQLSQLKRDFLSKFSAEHKRLKCIPYRPNGAAWNALSMTSDDALRILMQAEEYLKAPQPGNVYWKCKGLIERWLTENQGEWEETTDKGLAVFLKPDVLTRFLNSHKSLIQSGVAKLEEVSIGDIPSVHEGREADARDFGSSPARANRLDLPTCVGFR